MFQGLCNSPASFILMMLSIFGDLKFTSLLCYLDDLLVFAPTEEEAIEKLCVVLQKLRGNHLKLSPKKCHFPVSQVPGTHCQSGTGVCGPIQSGSNLQDAQ